MLQLAIFLQTWKTIEVYEISDVVEYYFLVPDCT